MRKITSLSGKVKKTPSSQADPQRYEFLDLQNAEPDLGIPVGNNYVLTSDTLGNRTWTDADNIITSYIDKTYVDSLGVNADTLDSQDGSYYLDFTNFTNIPDPNIEVILTGDVSGSANTTLTNLGNGVLAITTVVADDSHNHTIANIDGLQSALDGKIDSDANTILQQLLTVDGTGSNLDADLLDGQEGSYYLNFNNFTNIPDPDINVSLTGDVTGFGSGTLIDLASGNVSITTTVVDDSHNHTVSTITDFDSAVNTAITATVDKTFVDALNINADQLDGQEGSYYLDWTNTTNKPDPNIEVILTGDVSGSANTTLTNLGNGVLTITTVVADDSHNHTIENIDGLQTAIDGKLDADANTILTELLTVDGANSGLDADLLDGQEGSYYLDWTNTTNKPDPNIEVILTGDVTGSANVTLTDLSSGSLSITATVADDSHNHTISNVDGLQTALDGKADETITISTGSGLTGGGDLSTNRTISHADTSSQANTDNTNGNVVQNVEIDTFGHVTSLSSVDLDTRYVNTTGDTLTGFLTLHADPTNALHAATKEYVDTIASASLHYHDPVRVESPVDLSASYNNGTSGVGATLTGANEVLVIDGVTVSLNDRVLIYQQANTAHNGVYEVTQLGVSGTTPWILTRTTDADSYGPSDPTALGTGDAFFVQEGDTGAGELYVMTTEGTITFGTTAITFSQINSSQIYSAGAGLSLDGTVFSHANTSSQTDVGPLTGGNVVSAIDLDDFGHVTSLSTRTLTLSDLGFSGDATADNYDSWNLLVDGAQKDQITSGENVNLVGGSNVTLTYATANNTITIDATDTLANDATITLSAGSGLSGGGDFTTDQSVNETITFSHADTSSQASANNSGGTVIQDVTLDDYGHVTALGSKTLTTTDIDEGTNQYYTVARANSAIDARVTQSFVNALNVDADTLDSQDGSYYLDFANFTNIPDPNIEVVLTGDVTGSANVTLTDLGNGSLSITATVVDDSHNHTIANVDGLQDAINSKLDADANTILAELLTVDGANSSLDADLLDGQEGTYYLNFNNFTNIPDPNIQVVLTGDITGSGNTTLTDLASGTLTISTTVAANSVALGTDTTGNYVATITGTTNQVNVTGSGSESAAVTLSLPQDIHTSATPTFSTLDISSADGIDFTSNTGATLTFGQGYTPAAFTATPGSGGHARLYLNNSAANNQLFYGNTTGLLIGNGTDPQDTLDVRGNAIISGEVTATKLVSQISQNGPTEIVSVNTNTGSSARADIIAQSDSADIWLSATTSGYTAVPGWADSGVLSTSSRTSGGMLFNVLADAPFRFSNQGTERVRITASGNLGIGTDDPLQKLDVRGNIYTTGDLIFSGSTANNGFETTLTVTDPTADRTITLPDASGTVAFTSNKLSDFAATTSAELAGVISDETGTGSLVLGTSPTFTTSIIAGSTTMGLFDTTATTINFGGAATAIDIGAATGTTTVKNTLNVDGNIDLADNVILRFGTGDDMEIYHNGTHNYIDLNVGNLIIRDDGTAGDPTRFTFGRTSGNFTSSGNIKTDSGIVDLDTYRIDASTHSLLGTVYYENSIHNFVGSISTGDANINNNITVSNTVTADTVDADTVVTSSLQDSSNRTLRILDASGSVLWGG